MNAPVLPGTLNDNPVLERWVTFPAPGKVTVNTGRVELGQGVLTAMQQVAADELYVSPARVTVHSGDTVRAPNEGYTAGSQSIQTGAVAMRQACADVRALFLAQAAAIIGCIALYVMLPPIAIAVLPVWGAVGLLLYFSYSRRRSHVGRGIFDVPELAPEAPGIAVAPMPGAPVPPQDRD